MLSIKAVIHDNSVLKKILLKKLKKLIKRDDNLRTKTNEHYKIEYTNQAEEFTMNIQTIKSDTSKLRGLLVTFSILVSVVLLAGFSAESYAVNFGDDLNNNSTWSASADTSKVYSTVDEMPQIIGGLEALYKSIKYPEKARASNIEGQVFVQFVLDRQGKVTNPTIIRDIGGGCGDAAIAALKKVKFTPGKLGGEIVKVQYTLPVKFQIVK